MAPLSIEELSEQLVQVISERGDQIPEKFIQKDGFPQAIDVPDELWKDTLLIDFSHLSSFDSTELSKLKSALSNWGCFQVINHGIERSFIEEFMEVSKKFFGLPLEERLKSTSADKMFEGYGSDSAYIGKRVGWNDRILLTLFPKEKRDLQLWPQNPLKLREILEEYTAKLESIIEGIYKAMARSLNLEEDYFLNQMNQGLVTGRLNMYPRCSCPERVFGTWPHRDGSLITVLLVEPGAEGLQVEKDDQWFKVPVIPDTLFINFGDLGELMTNGIFKSVTHRVVTNSGKDRISWAAFCNPQGNIEVGPADGLITDDHPQKYKKLNLIEFKKVYLENGAVGRRTVDALKL